MSWAVTESVKGRGVERYLELIGSPGLCYSMWEPQGHELQDVSESLPDCTSVQGLRQPCPQRRRQNCCQGCVGQGGGQVLFNRDGRPVLQDKSGSGDTTQ